jgi:hypothetical protein
MLKNFVLNLASKEIQRSFGFLFQKEFSIRNAYVLQSSFDWVVELESKDCIIWVIWSRSQLFVEFTPVFGSKSVEKILLEAMVHYLSDGEVFIDNSPGNFSGGKPKQFERAADLLKKYIDQIAPFFGSKYYEHEEALSKASKRYYIKTSPKY